MCRSLPLGGALLLPLVIFLLPVTPSPFRTVWGGGGGGSIFPSVRRPPSHTVSASSSSHLGGLSPPSAGSSLPLPPPGGAEPSGHSSHPLAEGRGGPSGAGPAAGAGRRHAGRAAREPVSVGYSRFRPGCPRRLLNAVFWSWAASSFGCICPSSFAASGGSSEAQMTGPCPHHVVFPPLLLAKSFDSSACFD